jgi:hypothetical protein
MRAAALAVAIAAVAGCALLPRAGGAYPEACEGLGLAPMRCRVIVETVEERNEVAAESVVGVTLRPPTRQGVSLGGGPIVDVELHLADGSTIRDTFACVGVGSPSSRACVDEPRIETWDGIDHDVPCGEEPPAGCATEPSTPRPPSVAAARPLRIESLDIPLPRIGAYEVGLGEASLPDGYLTERSFALADDRPTDWWADDGIGLVVEPVDPGRPPIGSRFREPFDGVEPVRVVLRFTIVETAPGAVLRIRNVVVR